MPRYTNELSTLRHLDLTGIRFRLIDAQDQVVGRLSSKVALVLQGKDKPIFTNYLDQGDFCIIINASKVAFTGDKWDKKVYHHHTGYPGGLVSVTAKEIWRRDPTEILRKAIYGMLPDNRLRKQRMSKLRIFPDEEHPFKGFPLVPWSMPPRRTQDKHMSWPIPEGFLPMNPVAYQHRLNCSRPRPWEVWPPLKLADLLTEEERAQGLLPTSTST